MPTERQAIDAGSFDNVAEAASFHDVPRSKAPALERTCPEALLPKSWDAATRRITSSAAQSGASQRLRSETGVSERGNLLTHFDSGPGRPKRGVVASVAGSDTAEVRAVRGNRYKTGGDFRFLYIDESTMRPGLSPGHSAELTWPVTAERVIALGGTQRSGATVFSTPAMIELMEYAARAALEPFLEPGEESVGSRIEVEHLAATPIGVSATATATVTHVDGRLVDFEIVARDGVDLIGRGTHRRAVIRLDKFAPRLHEKVDKLSAAGGVLSGNAVTSGPLPILPTLQVRIEQAIAHVQLNRPAKRNSVNRQMTTDWEQLNAWLRGHPEVRVVLVSGAGDGFCAGDDVPEVGTLSFDAARELSLRQARMYLAWEDLPQVFIAVVHGNALGGGCVAAYSCDFRLASNDARFGMPEIKLGWPPGYGIAQLTALVGKARALQLCLTGEPITAHSALQFGLVHDVVPRQRLAAAAAELATRLLQQPAEALRETKRLIHADEGSGPKVAHLADTGAYIRCLALPDAKEGIAAFTEKRTPRFG
ncbi:MAG: thioesterase, FlK family [Planctomycetaceae bacterium]